jgi:hypothetical protein
MTNGGGGGALGAKKAETLEIIAGNSLFGKRFTISQNLLLILPKFGVFACFRAIASAAAMVEQLGPP